MGTGSSRARTTATNVNNQTYITKNELDIINKNLNSAVANAVIKNSPQCKADNTIFQTISFSNCEAKTGDINITGVSQDAAITADFSCINVSNVEQEMAQEVLTKLMGQIQSGMDVKSENAMDTYAKTAATTKGVLGGSASSSSSVDNKFNLTTINQTNTNIQNVISNAINANFNVENVQECVNNQKIKQEFLLNNCKAAGSINISDLKQVSSIDVFTNCLNQSGVAQAITNKAVNDLGVVVETDTKVATTSTMKNTLDTAATSTGIDGSLGSCGCDPQTCLIILIVIAVIFVLALVGYGIYRYNEMEATKHH